MHDVGRLLSGVKLLNNFSQSSKNYLQLFPIAGDSNAHEVCNRKPVRAENITKAISPLTILCRKLISDKVNLILKRAK